MIVRCGFGLGNRVTAIANGLQRFGQIRFVWRINDHCGLDHSVIFPHGIEGVEFVDAPPAPATRWDGIPAHAWDASASGQYAGIMSAMVGEAYSVVNRVIFARFHRHSGDIEAIASIATGRTLILTDSRRDELAALIPGAIMPRSPELKSDLADRNAGMLDFISDWKTMIECGRVITTSDKSSLLHPVLARFDNSRKVSCNSHRLALATGCALPPRQRQRL